ncbi:hypothetical protein ACHLPM_05490 [Enterococcus faecalis]
MRTHQKKLFLFSMILWLVEFLITRISDSFPGATPLFVVICLIQGILFTYFCLAFSIIRNNQSRKAIRADSANF